MDGEMAGAAEQDGGSSLKMRFASRLRELRLARGFAKARHFANELGILENRYTRYERGASEPDIALIHAFCDKLGVTPNELFGYPEEARTGRTTPHDFPGFASGPQAELVRSPESQPAPTQPPPAAVVPPPRPSPPGRPSELDKAAWELASLVVACRAGDASASPRPPLANLGATAELYKELRDNPYDAVASFVTAPATAGLDAASAGRIEAAIQDYIRLIS